MTGEPPVHRIPLRCSLYLWSRNFHRWLALVAVIPLVFIFITGILLNLSGQFQALQPKAPSKTNPGIEITYEQIVQAAQSVPEAGIKSPNDISQIDLRPKTGVVRVRANNYWEVQIDGHTGEVQGHGRRLKTLMVLLHEGQWFSAPVKYGVFLPAGIIGVILSLTGLVLYFYPQLMKRKKRV